MIASASFDKSIRLWDVLRRDCIAVFAGDGVPPCFIAGRNASTHCVPPLCRDVGWDRLL